MSEMVSVPRELVERAADGLEQSSYAPELANELRSCLPWEPPAEQVEALREAVGWASVHYPRETLARLRERGWKLVREDSDV